MSRPSGVEVVRGHYVDCYRKLIKFNGKVEHATERCPQGVDGLRLVFTFFNKRVPAALDAKTDEEMRKVMRKWGARPMTRVEEKKC